MLVYIITDADDGEVILAASSLANAEQLLFRYMGFDWNTPNADVVYNGFEEYVYSEFADDLEGVYSFRGLYAGEWTDCKFNLFCKELDKIMSDILYNISNE
jgi:hypothetical protein